MTQPALDYNPIDVMIELANTLASSQLNEGISRARATMAQKRVEELETQVMTLQDAMALMQHELDEARGNHAE